VSTISKVTIDLANFTQHNAQTTHTFGLKKQGASIKVRVARDCSASCWSSHSRHRGCCV